MSNVKINPIGTAFGAHWQVSHGLALLELEKVRGREESMSPVFDCVRWGEGGNVLVLI